MKPPKRKIGQISPIKEETKRLIVRTTCPLLEKASLCPPTRSCWRVRDAVEHLMAVEPLFEPVLEKFGIPTSYLSAEQQQPPIFHSLVRTIVYQQLAGAAAEAIFTRLLDAVGVPVPVPLQPNKEGHGRYVSVEQMRSAKFEVVMISDKKKIHCNGVIAGLSEAKMRAIQSCTEHFSDESLLKGVELNSLDDDTLIRKLTSIRGIGLWSCQMFMMFHLQRPNIFPLGDLGVRRGVCLFYPDITPKGDSKEAIAAVASAVTHWSPYSSLGTTLMWKIYDDSKNKTNNL